MKLTKALLTLGQIACVLLVLAGLCGCPTNPSWPTDEFDGFAVKGKLIVDLGNEKTALNFRWQSNATSNRVDLWGALGSYRTKIEFDDESLTIALADGTLIHEEDARHWLNANLGTDVAPQALISWLLLEPLVPERITNAHYGPDNQLLAFTELGWNIELLASTEQQGHSMPTRVRVTKSPIVLDIRSRTWTLK